MTGSPIIGIVDDDPGVRGSINSLVRAIGMTPRCFASAPELLAQDAGAFACIVSDVQMPGMSGLELQAEMRLRLWQVPLIMMTAFPADHVRDQALGAGACAFLTKPIDPDALIDAIEAAIG